MNKIFHTFLLIILAFACAAQETQPENEYRPDTSINKEPIYKPTIGLGAGMFSFYGDIAEKTYKNPLVARLAYDLTVGKKITPFLELNFYALFGKLGVNERSTTRNFNFESEIRAGGAALLYNFDQFLKPERRLSPYISVGIESFEFLSKTDLYDAKGNYYYYWDNGALKNLPQNSPDAANAIDLIRDYTYETDIREMNVDGFGKYPERSLAIPVGAGFKMHLSERFDFKVGATMHFTFTDYVDGITETSKETRAGNSKNDRFLMTSGAISYDFFTKEKDKKPEDPFEKEDLLADDLGDYDKDGVRDFIDLCAGTPPGVPVDANGCPLDEDQDKVPSYKDDELNTPPNVFVTTQGEQLTDSLIQLLYDMYMDSTGQFAKVISEKAEFGTVASASGKKYTVQLGTFTGGIPPDLINKFLSVPDITTVNLNDSTTAYIAGTYTNSLDAERRKNELQKAGIEGAIVVENQKGSLTPVPVTVSKPNPNNNVQVNVPKEKDVAGSSVQAVKATRRIDTSRLQSHNEIMVDITINKGAISDFAKLEETLPEGFTASEGVSSNAAFSFNDQVVKYIWLLLPSDETVKVSYKLNVRSGIKGVHYLNGELSYLQNNITKKTALENSEIKIGADDSQAIANQPITPKDNNQVNGEKDEVKEKPVDTSKPADTKTNPANTKPKELPISNNNLASDPANKVVFRVQMGAYSKKLSNNIFSDINDLVVIKTEDGLYKYLAGSFTDYNAVAKYKIDLLLKGFNGAFIVAYKNGKRVPLESVGATPASKEVLADDEESETASTAMDKSLIRFKVQLGAFKNKPPPDIQDKLNSVTGLEKQVTSTGITRYTAGGFTDYKQAQALKKDLASKGFPDAFIISFFKNEIIPVQEALELLEN